MKKGFWVYSCYLVLAAFLCGCATTSVISTPQLKAKVIRIGGARYISADSFSQAYNLDSDWDSIARKLTLRKGDQEVRVMADSAVALINNTAQTMEEEAKFYRGSLVIPQSFVQSKLIPLFKERYIERRRVPAEVSGLPIRTVIIDPGHGGKDPGAIGRGGLKEKDVVLDIARKLKAKLNAAGIKVILTRESDQFVSLSQRAKIANATEADFFISIHANASRSRWVSGVEVFCLSESIDDNLRSFKAAENYDLNIQEPYSGKDTAAILWHLIYRDDRKSANQMARLVCSSLSRGLSQRNRGTKPARFYVLKTNMPAILVEVGFISNLAEEKRLRTAAYRNKIAQGITEGIVEYHRQLTQKRYTQY